MTPEEIMDAWYAQQADTQENLIEEVVTGFSYKQRGKRPTTIVGGIGE